jgi:hypothetical protein
MKRRINAAARRTPGTHHKGTKTTKDTKKGARSGVLNPQTAIYNPAHAEPATRAKTISHPQSSVFNFQSSILSPAIRNPQSAIRNLKNPQFSLSQE